MSQFKRFNTSENGNWDDYATYPAGTLTWDPNNGLRIHDGNTGGGNQVGSTFDGNYWNLNNRPYGASAIHDVIGGGSSANTGKFLMQTNTTESQWTDLPTTYDTLTVNTKVLGGLDGAAGTKISGIEATLGSGAPWRYVFLSANDAFANLFNRGTSIIGWKMYPASNPSAFVTITEYLNSDLGGPSLGFSGSLAQGPWVAESSDYNAGTPGPLVLSADTKNWTLDTSGNLTLPAGGDIKDSNGDSVFFSSSYNDLSDKPSIPTDVSDLTDNNSLLPAAQVRYIMKSASFTAEIGKVYWLDSTSGAYTVTLPASPTTGDWVTVYDAEMKWTSNNVTVDGNGHNVRIMNMGGGGFAWSSPASTVTLNQAVYSPVGPMPNKFVWNGTVWSGSM